MIPIVKLYDFDRNPLSIDRQNQQDLRTILHNLRSSILWAIDAEEDVIFCKVEDNENNLSKSISYDNIINDLVDQGIYFYYINVECGSLLSIDENIAVVYDIKSISSFILTRPIFNLALSLIDNIGNIENQNWLSFCKILAPDSFAILKHDSHNFKNFKIHVISPFRNVSLFIDEYITTVEKQKYSDFNIHLIDDASTDGGISKFITDSRFSLIENPIRQFALKNIVDTLLRRDFGDDDIICLIDADDILPHDYVFTIINQLYNDESLLFTYGSVRVLGNYICEGTPYSIEEFSTLRKSEWKVSHLRTFRYKLFKEYQRLDPRFLQLKDLNLDFLKMPYDMALLFPLMEIAGFERIRFIESVLYEYRFHSNNDHNISREEQYRGEKIIRNKIPLTKSLNL
ncbi:glycosyltransferase family A protein [Sphingobacterium sp. DR205]|uniref:glycosyltransferase family A protein n=1 Tax=Sphingobacterium sp. DR205 TaxID=2713573 RepID=UPI0013E494C2|nr:glycosyltransferase family A protein [Sphingobacterium sp. DR205]QIH36740.1 glycosyltransferase family 2 protein [Sphingobacterium sp. DR205]